MKKLRRHYENIVKITSWQLTAASLAVGALLRREC